MSTPAVEQQRLWLAKSLEQYRQECEAAKRQEEIETQQRRQAFFEESLPLLKKSLAGMGIPEEAVTIGRTNNGIAKAVFANAVEALSNGTTSGLQIWDDRAGGKLVICYTLTDLMAYFDMLATDLIPDEPRLQNPSSRAMDAHLAMGGSEPDPEPLDINA